MCIIYIYIYIYIEDACGGSSPPPHQLGIRITVEGSHEAAKRCTAVFLQGAQL